MTSKGTGTTTSWTYLPVSAPPPSVLPNGSFAVVRMRGSKGQEGTLLGTVDGFDGTTYTLTIVGGLTDINGLPVPNADFPLGSKLSVKPQFVEGK
jgi:hypothetical protein